MATGGDNAFFLTEEDIRILRTFLDQVKKDRVNTPRRPTAESREEDSQDHEAPSTYVCKPPINGLPPLSNIIGAPDRPGVGVCKVYMPEENSSGDVVLKDAGFSITVYNVSEAIVDTPYIIAHRNKYGVWVYECPCVVTGTGTTGTGTTGTGTTGTGTGTTGTGTTGTGTTGTGTSTATGSTGTGTTGTAGTATNGGGGCPERQCIWEWNGVIWTLISVDEGCTACPGSCCCNEPPSSGEFIGEQQTTFCAAS